MMELFFIFLIIGILYFFGGQIIDGLCKLLEPLWNMFTTLLWGLFLIGGIPLILLIIIQIFKH